MEPILYFAATSLASVVTALPNKLYDTSCLSKQSAWVLIAVGGMMGMAQADYAAWVCIVGVALLFALHFYTYSTEFTPTSAPIRFDNNRNP